MEKRAEWLAKNYPRTVVADTLAAWAEAVGADAYVGRFRTAGLYEPVEGSLRLLERVLEERPALRTTIYDAYLPWVAKTLNEQHKIMLRVHRELAAQSTHALVRQVGEARDYAEVQKARSMVRDGEHHLAREMRVAGMAAIDDYTLLRDQMISRFGAIGRWANEERADLGPLSMQDVWDDRVWPWLDTAQWGDSCVGTDASILVYAWPDGWAIRELKTKADLIYEGSVMGHCTGSYGVARDGAIRETPHSEVIRLFSLRDRQNRPHATMAWVLVYRYVNQLRGRGNVLPMPKHTARVAEFRDQMFPTDAPRPVAVPATDTVRKESKFFDGRYAIPRGLSGSGDVLLFEVWGGNVYVGIEDVDEAIEDELARFRSRGLSDAQVAKLMRNFNPDDLVLSVEISMWYDWWFARRGPDKALLDNDDELAKAVRTAVTEGKSKPIFERLRSPTGKPISPS